MLSLRSPYIRGRTLANAFFIVDEAQNLTPHEVKTIISRAGDGTKVVFTGDINQIDTPYLDAESNGLSYVIDKVKNNPLFAHITLEKGERSELANLANELCKLEQIYSVFIPLLGVFIFPRKRSHLVIYQGEIHFFKVTVALVLHRLIPIFPKVLWP